MKCEKCKHYKVAPYGEPCDSCSEFIYFEPITNADRIRTMSDEELAKWIDVNMLPDEFLEGRENDKFIDVMIDWLKQEVE